MLQHLWTGPISNAAVDVVQGLKSVEVRPIGVSKVRFFARFGFVGTLIYDSDDESFSTSSRDSKCLISACSQWIIRSLLLYVPGLRRARVPKSQ
jgi:hypothetical protein